MSPTKHDDDAGTKSGAGGLAGFIFLVDCFFFIFHLHQE